MAVIYTWELSALNAKRDHKLLGKIMAALVVFALFLAVGLGMFFSGINKGAISYWLPGLVVTVVGFIIGYLLFKKIAAPRNELYKLFAENDVFVEAPAWRNTEQLALDQFNGDLKSALRHIAESPDFYISERRDYIAEWRDYEKDYIRELYGKDPSRVARSHKTRELTHEKIEHEGFSLLGEDSFELVQGFCSQKTQPSMLVDGDDAYRLYFGEYGSYECTNTLFRNTNVGDSFYIIRGSSSGTICLVYPTLEWHLHEDLIDLLP